ncbi:hypothetical protein D9M68_999880 [compost metagenome]
MAQGLQIFDEYGRVILDTNTRVFTLMGYVDTGTNDGSLHVPDLGRGTPVFFASAITPLGQFSRVPGITISGQTIVWAFNKNQQYGTDVSVRIYYGVH